MGLGELCMDVVVFLFGVKINGGGGFSWIPCASCRVAYLAQLVWTMWFSPHVDSQY